MRVKVLFFGLLKDVTGRAEDSLDVSPGATVEEIFSHYAGAHPRLAEMRTSIVLARNHEFASAATLVEDGDEIALLPPVSGGAAQFTEEIADDAGDFFALTREPIDVRALSARLVRPEDGAAVAFDGVVRNNTKGRPTLYLDYECYEPLAIKTMARIGADLSRCYSVSRVGMVHRLGRLAIGETSVAIVVTAPHRKPAFEACLEGINRLKRLVPIWKKEYFADGEVWVEGDWDPSVVAR